MATATIKMILLSFTLQFTATSSHAADKLRVGLPSLATSLSAAWIAVKIGE